MQPQHLERLKRMINSSSLLTAQEKQEWLNLLIVMNDKQVSELEAILNTPAEKPMPPLTHISNLPAGISQAVPAPPRPTPPPIPRYPLPKAMKPNPLQQWEAKFRRSVEEKELSTHAAQIPQAPQTANSAPTAPKPAPIHRPQGTERQSAPVKSEPPARIVEPKDTANLTLGNIRAPGSNLAETLKQMVASSNYFEVLFYLEKSPLYQTYLETGRQALSGSASPFPAAIGGKNLLTKAEFEAFSDLLQSIQIS